MGRARTRRPATSPATPHALHAAGRFTGATTAPGHHRTVDRSTSTDDSVHLTRHAGGPTRDGITGGDRGIRARHGGARVADRWNDRNGTDPTAFGAPARPAAPRADARS